MSISTRKKTRKRDFSGNHQRGWLWGHHAVTETLLTGDWPVKEIVVTSQALDRYPELFAAQRDNGVPLEVVDNDRIEQLTKSREHQGFAIRLGRFPYRSLGEFLTRLQNTPDALVVICDRLQDAFNFGAILRCCDGVNVSGVIVGSTGQVEVTPHVVRASSGAVNHIPIVEVENLLDAANAIKQHGLKLVAADSNTSTGVWESGLTSPTALVIGSEAHGIAPELLAICDLRVCIPMQGKVTSLNAAVAAGILLYEIRRQQSFTN